MTETNVNDNPAPEDAPAPSVDPTGEVDQDPSVDTGPLERAQQAIDEGNDAAARALDDQSRGEAEMDFENVETNTDPEASDNAVPRPN